MTTYYVESTGSDSVGDGSVANPWRTVGHSVGTVPAGSTIQVGAGEFVEAFYVDKDVTIVGIGRVDTVLRFSQPANEFQPVLEIRGAIKVRLERLRIDGAYGFFLFNRNGLFATDGGAAIEIENCAIEGFFNFYVEVVETTLAVSNSQIGREPAYQNDIGIRMWDSTATITNTSIGGQVDHCIDLRGTSYAEIIHCALNGSDGSNNHGIRMLDSSVALIGYNTIVGKGASTVGFDQGIQAGIFLNDDAVAAIFNNDISAFAVGLRHTSRGSSRVWGNRITNNFDWGIECFEYAQATAFQPDLGGGRHGSPGQNVIKDNGAAGGNDIKLQGSGTLFARFNDWGTTNPAEIEARAPVATSGPWGPAILDFLPVYGTPDLVPLDSVLLLDCSGSMLAEQKWNSATDGVRRLTTILREIACNVETLRLGLVTFAYTGSDMTNVPRPLSALPADPTEMTSGLTPPQPQWMTPLGQGLDTARNALGSLDDGRRKFIFLLSDGKNNFGPDPATIYPGFEGRINVYSIGYGDDAIDPDMLSEISAGTFGDYNLTGSTDKLQLHTFLLNILPNPMNIGLVLNTTDGAVSSFPINEGESKMLVFLGWADASITLNFDLQNPNGTTYTPTDLPGGVAYRQANGLSSASYVVDNPLGGDWKIANIQREGGGTVPETVRFVAVDPRVIGQFWMDREPKWVGKPFRLGARLLEAGIPIEKAEITVDVMAPRQATGELASSHAKAFPDWLKNLQKSKSLVAQDFRKALLQDYLHHQKLKALPSAGTRIKLRPRSPSNTLELPTIGKPPVEMPDFEPPAGLYEAKYTPTVEGTHTFRITARSRTAKDSPILRTYTIGTYVHFKADPNRTEVAVVPIGTWRDHYRRFRVSVTPRSSAGDRLGPFRGEHITFRVDNARFIGAVDDDGIGGYSRDFVVFKSKTPWNLIVRVRDMTIEVPDTKGKGTGKKGRND